MRMSMVLFRPTIGVNIDTKPRLLLLVDIKRVIFFPTAFFFSMSLIDPGFIVFIPNF